jgi:cysteine desulfurase/selenocysteine lyase
MFSVMNAFDLGLKKDFPVFTHHPSLVFLDNAATTQKPQVVIDTQRETYEKSYANVHRAVYDLAAQATEKFENTRIDIAAFIGAQSADEIIFTRNATEALNLIAWIEAPNIQAGDEILISVAEHHSNLLPWQRLACKRGAKLTWIELDEEQKLDLDDFQKKLSPETKLVAVAHVSNVLGHAAPLDKIIPAAHAVGAKVVVDAAQSAARFGINVQELDADYMAFSSHKMYGPTGVGFLYAKKKYIEKAEPMIIGGGTIKRVTREAAMWHDAPLKFEGGTPAIAEVIALGAAIQYMQRIGMENIWAHDQAITAYALEKLSEVEGLQVYGPAMSENRAGIISFTFQVGQRIVHPHDVAEIANTEHVAIRGGHHCAQVLMDTLQVPALNRISIGVYNTQEDIDRAVEALEKTTSIFS